MQIAIFKNWKVHPPIVLLDLVKTMFFCGFVHWIGRVHALNVHLVRHCLISNLISWETLTLESDLKRNIKSDTNVSDGIFVLRKTFPAVRSDNSFCSLAICYAILYRIVLGTEW